MPAWFQAAGQIRNEKSYASYAVFGEPDGNGCVVQEVTAGLTQHIEAGHTGFTTELTSAGPARCLWPDSNQRDVFAA